MPEAYKDYVPAGPSRISQMVINSVVIPLPPERGLHEDPSLARYKKPDRVMIKSPLSVVFDFLTVPDLPATRAYALLTLRNYIFETFDAIPETGASDGASIQSFDFAEIERAHSRVSDGFDARSRRSGGQWPVAKYSVSPAENVLKHYHAANGFLWLLFEKTEEALDFLNSQNIKFEQGSETHYSFFKPPSLERFPEVGEIVNALWGLPIPVRGADTLFRGGLKFSAKGGLVIGLHGGPGTGKTTFALSLGALSAPFGIKTLFITAEEARQDLFEKADTLISGDMKKLSLFPKTDWLYIDHLDDDADNNSDSDKSPSQRIGDIFESMTAALSAQHGATGDEAPQGVPKVCRTIVVLDGVHDLMVSASTSDNAALFFESLRQFIARCRRSKALVILTMGENWNGQQALDYLVDVAIKLSQDHVGEYGRKPDRQITISKARHQLCSIGAHGMQIAGAKGLRFSPQINYQLDRKALWKTPLPEIKSTKLLMRLPLERDVFDNFFMLGKGKNKAADELKSAVEAEDVSGAKVSLSDNEGVRIFRGSNILLNGEGSGGKAALALKIAISPSFELSDKPDNGLSYLRRAEKVLVISFLYPKDYYQKVMNKLLKNRHVEYDIPSNEIPPIINVIQLYPGHYRADQFFNKVEWELESAELRGDSYTCVVIDGLHNVYMQFPEIEAYTLFWAQFFASLRARAMTVISTHTTFLLQQGAEKSYHLDDKRSTPLLHALIQKTDFMFQIDPCTKFNAEKAFSKEKNAAASNFFMVSVVAAISQPIPENALMWSRQHLVLFMNEVPSERPESQMQLPLEDT